MQDKYKIQRLEGHPMPDFKKQFDHHGGDGIKTVAYLNFDNSLHINEARKHEKAASLDLDRLGDLVKKFNAYLPPYLSSDPLTDAIMRANIEAGRESAARGFNPFSILGKK